jgi:hypothetical protein
MQDIVWKGRKGKTREKKVFYFEGWRKGVSLFEGSQAFPARISDTSSMKTKTPEWW